MSWRSDDWPEKLRELYNKFPYQNSTEAYTFGAACMEFGADAMLEALKNSGGFYVPGKCFFYNVPIVKPVGGMWVFIPDDTGEAKDSEEGQFTNA